MKMTYKKPFVEKKTSPLREEEKAPIEMADTPLSHEEECALMVKISEQNALAFQIIVTQHSKKIYALLYRLSQNAARAEDLTQDVFLTLWQKADYYTPEKARLSTWLYQIALNKFRDSTRLVNRFVALFENEDLRSHDHTPEKAVILNERQEKIKRAIIALKPDYKTALILFYYQEKSQKEIALIMGKTDKAVERLIARAREQLSQSLRKEFPDEDFQAAL